MIRNTLIAIGLMTAFTFAACENDPIEPETYPNYAQLKVGNYWIYELYTVDSLGNATSLNQFDSAYVEKDTLINGKTYYKYIRGQHPLARLADTFVRDSLHYIVNRSGERLFSSQNFSDNLYNQPFIIEFPIPDTVCQIIAKMDDKDMMVSTPAGTFVTYNYKKIFYMFPNWDQQGRVRVLDTRYAENVGIVIETYPFYTSMPGYVQKRLVRYRVN